MLSESEAEDDPNNHVMLHQKIISRGNIEANKSSIKLSELGPRLTLQLIKIEDGLLDGEVLYHDFVEKTEEEKLLIQKKRESKRRLKENRKKIQQINKNKKETAKQELKKKSVEGMHTKTDETNHDDNDVEYYRKEVGQEPDKGEYQKIILQFAMCMFFRSFQS